MTAAEWRARRTFRARDFVIEQLLQNKTDTISVILPAREEAATIGGIIDAIRPLRELGLVDEILVIDAASRDGTAAIAAARGATVVQENDLLAEFGPSAGKGDAMWRALSVATGVLVVFIDADTRDFSPDFVVGLLGPLLTLPELRFVKGAYRRPLMIDGCVMPGEGGRVTELVARPLLNLHAPELAGFDQPLAGEMAAHADLLRAMAFPAGYGVELANLLDAARLAGLDALAQVDLGTRQNSHQPLRELTAMAYAVMVAAGPRLGDPGLSGIRPTGHMLLRPSPEDSTPETRHVAILERPPLCGLPGVQVRRRVPGQAQGASERCSR